MKITKELPLFTPITITLETQEEVNMLGDTLYEIDLTEFNELKRQHFIRDLRVDLYEFHVHKS
jgi:hypothetical protein